MDLINYIENLLIDEEKIIQELISIDNKICNRNISYQEIIRVVKNIKIDNVNIDKKVDIITDGEINSVLYALINYNTNINKIHIDRTFLAINKWLIQRINEYYNINIILDDKINYNNYYRR